MARDPFALVLRLRRLAREEAARELGACLERQSQAEAAVAFVRQAIAAEQEAASRPETDDPAVEAFGRWLGRARAMLAAAASARAAAEAAATSRTEAKQRGQLAAEQAAIDEAAGRRRK